MVTLGDALQYYVGNIKRIEQNLEIRKEQKRRENSTVLMTIARVFAPDQYNFIDITSLERHSKKELFSLLSKMDCDDLDLKVLSEIVRLWSGPVPNEAVDDLISMYERIKRELDLEGHLIEQKKHLGGG